MIHMRRIAHELLNRGKGIRREGVDSGDPGNPTCGGGGERVEGGEEEDQHDEAVFAAVVAET